MMQLARVCMQRTAEEEAGVYPPYLANIEICQSTRNQWKVLHASSFCVTSCRSNMNLYPDTARINTGTVTPRDEAHRSRVMSGIFRISAINWSMAVGALWWPRVTSTWMKCQFRQLYLTHIRGNQGHFKPILSILSMYMNFPVATGRL